MIGNPLGYSILLSLTSGLYDLLGIFLLLFPLMFIMVECMASLFRLVVPVIGSYCVLCKRLWLSLSYGTPVISNLLVGSGASLAAFSLWESLTLTSSTLSVAAYEEFHLKKWFSLASREGKLAPNFDLSLILFINVSFTVRCGLSLFVAGSMSTMEPPGERWSEYNGSSPFWSCFLKRSKLRLLEGKKVSLVIDCGMKGCKVDIFLGCFGYWVISSGLG